jgi:hypothetical protein
MKLCAEPWQKSELPRSSANIRRSRDFGRSVSRSARLRSGPGGPTTAWRLIDARVDAQHLAGALAAGAARQPLPACSNCQPPGAGWAGRCAWIPEFDLFIRLHGDTAARLAPVGLRCANSLAETL